MSCAWLLAALLAPPASAAFPAVERTTAPIAIVYPSEGQALGALEANFVMGSVSDPKALFTINGETVTPHADGAFLAWIGLKPGTFTIHCELKLKDGAAAYARSVFVAPPAAPLPDKPLSLDKDSLWPRQDMELRAGDWLVLRARATPHSGVQFRLGKKQPWKPMAEMNPAQGIYEGTYFVGPGESLDPTEVEYQAGSGWGSASAKSGGQVSFVTAPPRIALIRGNGTGARLKTGPGEGELFPAANGERFMVVGRVGMDFKLQLPNGEAAWVEGKYLEFLPPGAAPPRAATDVISVKAGENSTVVHVGLTDRVPFRVDESEDGRSLVLKLYYTWAHTNWVVYASEDPLVSEVRFSQENSDTVAVTVRANPGQTLWGYHASYEGNSVRLELRHAPKLAAAPEAPLSGVSIFLDPGHMPSAPGATGPLGTHEMDINYAIAKTLEQKLSAQGAKVLLSRRNPDDEVGLPDRPRMAWEKRADLFVSVHNNFLGDGSNPFKGVHGYSVFYYHPHSLELARDVYKAYDGRVPLPGEELRFGDLLVARMTEMPAILTESAYLTYPEQEALLLDSGFRDKVASAIDAGVRQFIDAERERQNPGKPKEKARPAANAPQTPAGKPEKPAKKTGAKKAPAKPAPKAEPKAESKPAAGKSSKKTKTKTQKKPAAAPGATR